MYRAVVESWVENPASRGDIYSFPFLSYLDHLHHHYSAHIKPFLLIARTSKFSLGGFASKYLKIHGFSSI